MPNPAEGNPPLLDVMQCAQDNAQLTIEHVLAALKIIQPLLDMLSPLISFTGKEIKIPVLDLAGADPDVGKMLEKMKAAAEALEAAAEAIGPC